MNTNNFRWKSHNLTSMLNSVNKKLDDLKVDKKFRLKVNMNILYIGNGVQFDGTVDQLGNIVYAILIFLDVWKSTETKHTKIVKEFIKVVRKMK